MEVCGVLVRPAYLPWLESGNRTLGEQGMRKKVTDRILLLAVGWLLLILVILAGSPTAHASRLFFELPVMLEYDGDIAGSATEFSGYSIAWGFDFNVGLGLSALSSTAEDSGKDIKGDVDYTFTDVFFYFKAFALDWQLGYGFGTAEMALEDSGGNSFTVDEVVSSQIIITIGYPIGKSSAVHLGYRSISALAEDYQTNGASTGTSFDLSANLLSLGIQFGF